MGRMKELAMQLREQEMWEDMSRAHDEFMMDVAMSGYPSHMVDMYGEPTRNEVIIDELPWTCQVCNDVVAPGNEYCGKECADIYHERKKKEDDLPF